MCFTVEQMRCLRAGEDFPDELTTLMVSEVCRVSNNGSINRPG